MRRLGFHRPDHPGNLRLATGLDRFARRIRDDDTIDDRRRGARHVDRVLVCADDRLGRLKAFERERHRPRLRDRLREEAMRQVGDHQVVHRRAAR